MSFKKCGMCVVLRKSESVVGIKAHLAAMFVMALQLIFITPTHAQLPSPTTVRLDNIFSQLDPAVSNQTVFYPNFGFNIRGWLDSTPSPIDSDLVAKGITSVLTNVDPTISSSSAFGFGRIKVLDGLMTKVSLQYGIRGNQPPPLGGFTAFSTSKYFGNATARPGSVGTVGNFQNEGGVFYQFATDLGQPTGPATLQPIYSEPAKGVTATTFNSFSWTTGTSLNNPTDITRAGKSEIGDIRIDVIPAKDILKDSITRVQTGNPWEYKLVFQPNHSGIRLEDLADSLGVDHFNWFQQVTHLPTGVTPGVFKSSDNFVNNFESVGYPSSQIDLLAGKSIGGLVDALPQFGPEEHAYGWVKNGGIVGHWEQDFVDGALPVYNELGVPYFRNATPETPSRWDIRDTRNTDLDLSTLHFVDAPQNAFLNLSDPNDYFGFRTELIGVRNDGSIRWLADDFPDANLFKNWGSNTLVAFNNDSSFGIASTLHGTYLGGGTFDIASVPESTSLILVFAALIIVFYSRFRFSEYEQPVCRL